METIDVVTVGCGPTGALLSAYLGRYGVKNLVLEREEAVTTDPRGIALDGEGMRCLQGVGASARFWLDVGDGKFWV
jgi:2-polyprenyl-6-methoxyphenol hydroxylase-like FAD-dependent oxidoreductase